MKVAIRCHRIPLIGANGISVLLMAGSPEKRSQVAIKIEGGRNIRLDDNVSVGMPLLEATDVENLSGFGNKILGEPSPGSRKAGYASALAKAGIALLVAIVAGGIIYYLGWN